MIRTLIVDDDPFVRMSLQTILEAQDDVEVCALGADGDEAVELFERERPDVLLMDIQMPGSDGLGAAERILGAHKHARIVFLTTFSDDEYIVRALRLGGEGLPHQAGSGHHRAGLAHGHGRSERAWRRGA